MKLWVVQSQDRATIGPLPKVAQPSPPALTASPRRHAPFPKPHPPVAGRSLPYTFLLSPCSEDIHPIFSYFDCTFFLP